MGRHVQDDVTNILENKPITVAPTVTKVEYSQDELQQQLRQLTAELASITARHDKLAKAIFRSQQLTTEIADIWIKEDYSTINQAINWLITQDKNKTIDFFPEKMDKLINLKSQVRNSYAVPNATRLDILDLINKALGVNDSNAWLI